MPVLRYKLAKDAALVLSQGDITRWKGDAIVNAANSRMLGGGGVDGAIHRAAGPELYKACLQYPDGPGGRCPTGEARITSGFNLPAKHVIHTVGPVYFEQDATESARLLGNAYRSSLGLANDNDLRTIAFPAISCGVYGYPLNEAAEVAMRACAEAVGSLDEVHFVLFDEGTFSAWQTVASKDFPSL